MKCDVSKHDTDVYITKRLSYFKIRNKLCETHQHIDQEKVCTLIKGLFQKLTLLFKWSYYVYNTKLKLYHAELDKK